MPITPDSLPQSPDDDRYIAAYRKEIEKQLLSLANDALEHWLKDSNKAVEKALKIALDQLADAISSSYGNQTVFNPASNADGALSFTDFGNRLGNILSSVVVDALEERRTSTNVRESERSQQTNADFKLSRSQKQAAASQELSRGNRNL